MSKENVEKLKDLKEDLESLERSHAEILEAEGHIARTIHEASAEARRRYMQVATE